MKKYGPNERIDQNSIERTKQQGDSQPIRCRVQNTGNQDAHRIQPEQNEETRIQKK